ncbi:30S ribosomal protein S13 [Candidatus Pacearchaeota archaeon]|nr:30S ribosomal protein S13 [Candidatus Pacearchaeota archaeon]
MEQEIKNKGQRQESREERLVRILSKDIEGKMNVYAGLTKIKGISWSLSNAICKKLGIDKRKKIGFLTEEEIKKITTFVKEAGIPAFLLNRRNDFETGENKHFVGSDLELRREFDIKRLRKIKSYKGLRHASGQPVRGQRTKGHFRSNRKKSTGVKKKTSKTATPERAEYKGKGK